MKYKLGEHIIRKNGKLSIADDKKHLIKLAYRELDEWKKVRKEAIHEVEEWEAFIEELEKRLAINK